MSSTARRALLVLALAASGASAGACAGAAPAAHTRDPRAAPSLTSAELGAARAQFRADLRTLARVPGDLLSGGPDGAAVDAAIADLEYFAARLLEGRWPGRMAADVDGVTTATGNLRNALTQWVSVTQANLSSWTASIQHTAAALTTAENRVLRDLGLPSLTTDDPFGRVKAPPPPTLQAQITFSGSGSVQTRSFSTVGGLMIFRAKCVCAPNAKALPAYADVYFTITVDAASGTAATPIAVTGGYEGSAPAYLPAGTYYLLVDANGPWSVDVVQAPLARRQPARLPRTYAGTGQQVVGPIAAGDSLTVSASNRTTDPSSQFSVVVWTPDGYIEATPFSRYGNFAGSATLRRLPAVPYYLAISGGRWVVTLQGPPQVV